MFKLLEDNTKCFIYQAEFTNPVTISYDDDNILLTDKCVICICDYHRIELFCTVVDINYENNNITIRFERRYCLKYIRNASILALRDIVKEVNQAIKDTYKPGGHMYNKSEQLIKELTNV